MQKPPPIPKTRSKFTICSALECQAPITWVLKTSGTPHPIDGHVHNAVLFDPKVHTSHFDTCPAADHFRKKAVAAITGPVPDPEPVAPSRIPEIEALFQRAQKLAFELVSAGWMARDVEIACKVLMGIRRKYVRVCSQQDLEHRLINCYDRMRLMAQTRTRLDADGLKEILHRVVQEQKLTHIDVERNFANADAQL